MLCGLFHLLEANSSHARHSGQVPETGLNRHCQVDQRLFTYQGQLTTMMRKRKETSFEILRRNMHWKSIGQAGTNLLMETTTGIQNISRFI
jgi:hypothetical protein